LKGQQAPVNSRVRFVALQFGIVYRLGSCLLAVPVVIALCIIVEFIEVVRVDEELMPIMAAVTSL
jgi:hypothetical protein